VTSLVASSKIANVAKPSRSRRQALEGCALPRL